MPETVFYSIGVDHPITPDEPLPPMAAIPRGCSLSSKAGLRSGATAWHFTDYMVPQREPLQSSILALEPSSSPRIIRTGARDR